MRYIESILRDGYLEYDNVSRMNLNDLFTVRNTEDDSVQVIEAKDLTTDIVGVVEYQSFLGAVVVNKYEALLQSLVKYKGMKYTNNKSTLGVKYYDDEGIKLVYDVTEIFSIGKQLYLKIMLDSITLSDLDDLPVINITCGDKLFSYEVTDISKFNVLRTKIKMLSKVS
jgi:hypothetical protein